MQNNTYQNSNVCPLLTDLYQITMAYGYWKNKRIDDHAVFDLFFRKNPFKGEFCLFGGLGEVVDFVKTFRFTEEHINYLKIIMPSCDAGFFEWLSSIDCSGITIYAMKEGTIVFPREPLIRIEGPLAIAQLLETTLLNLVNFPSLITTNAARMRLATSPGKTMLEFGLRRAQGPDGALTASKYSYIGGFNGTSNVLAGMRFGIPVVGTHAHSYVMSYTALENLSSSKIVDLAGREVEFAAVVSEKAKLLSESGFGEGNVGERAAFISYAQAFPSGFLALVDTYDSLHSGVPNFLAVGWALREIGYAPKGVRLDSGDLAYLSIQTRALFKKADELIGKPYFSSCSIVVSNDINEDVLWSLQRSGNEIDVFAVGTNLVTCQKQPALGCVFKLVEINSQPRIKLSQEVEKTVIPGRKRVFRLYGSGADYPLIDVIQMCDEPIPVIGQRILCRHPFEEQKRCYVTPTKVVELLCKVWDGPAGGCIEPPASIHETREYCISQLTTVRSDHLRQLNPTPYKVAVSSYLFDFTHRLWLEEAPIFELKV